jgi:hypothetical protein
MRFLRGKSCSWRGSRATAHPDGRHLTKIWFEYEI